MPALLQELRTAIGFHKQSAVGTALVAADCWSLRTTSRDMPQPVPVNESDREDLGKGVYATQLFKSHWNTAFPMNGRLTSEWASMLACFGLGKTTEGTGTPSTAITYSCTAPDLAADGLDMPLTTIVAAIRQGGSAISDKALLDMACEEFGFQFNSGPGRDNAQFTSTWVGSGKHANPSTITLPALATEHSLNSGGISTLTILTINYLTSKRFVSANFSWKNNIRLDSGFYPGSGTQSGFQIRGRMRRGTPEVNFSCVVEAETGTAEESNLLSQTEGTVVLDCDGAQIGVGPATHQLKITLHRVVPRATQIAENDGIATYAIEFEVLQHSSNGVLTIETVCEKEEILTSA